MYHNGGIRYNIILNTEVIMLIHKIQNIIITLMIILLFASCNRNTAILEEMGMAENLMDSKPDSALTILENIPVTNIKGKEIAARYALLKSIALDKNYIDTTTFDVLQPAIDYYLKKGSPDEKLRTYYYQGRIYQNQGDDDCAMQSFLNGCDLKQVVTDSLLLAHTLVAQGTLYLKQYKINEFVQNNIEAAKLYGAIGKDIFEIKSYTNALDGYVMLNNQSPADSILSICIPLVQKNPDGQVYLFTSLLTYTIKFSSTDDLKTFLDKFRMRCSKSKTG
jgi:tetratricopeptide (TPR) repeat protein